MHIAIYIYIYMYIFMYIYLACGDASEEDGGGVARGAGAVMHRLIKKGTGNNNKR